MSQETSEANTSGMYSISLSSCLFFLPLAFIHVCIFYEPSCVLFSSMWGNKVYKIRYVVLDSESLKFCAFLTSQPLRVCVCV